MSSLQDPLRPRRRLLPRWRRAEEPAAAMPEEGGPWGCRSGRWTPHACVHTPPTAVTLGSRAPGWPPGCLRCSGHWEPHPHPPLTLGLGPGMSARPSPSAGPLGPWVVVQLNLALGTLGSPLVGDAGQPGVGPVDCMSLVTCSGSE